MLMILVVTMCNLHSQVSRDEQESEVGNSSGAAEGSVSSGDVDDCFDGKESDKDFKKKKNRCALCRKKVGLTGEYKAILDH